MKEDGVVKALAYKIISLKKMMTVEAQVMLR